MKKEPSIILGNAIIWGAVIIGCSLALKGTECYPQIQLILGGGAAASLLLLGGGMAKKKKG